MNNRRAFILIIAAFFLIVPYPSHSQDYQDDTVQIVPIHSQNRYPAGGKYPLLFRITIEKNWYIHGVEKENEFIFPTALTFSQSSNLKIKDIKFPKPESVKFSYRDEPVDVYSGSILVKATLVVSKKTPEGEHVIKGKLAYQACTDKMCDPPFFQLIAVSFDIVPRDAPFLQINQDIFRSVWGEKGVEKGLLTSGFEAGFLLTLVGLFLGGLALNLTPCIYPLIPITVSYFSGKGQVAKTSAIAHGVLYIFGLSLTNSVLGVSAALSGELLGASLQNPFVLIFVAGIMIALGLSFFGLWEFRLPTGWTKFAVKTYSGYFGTFFMGLTLGIVCAPCLGPFILGLLTYVGQMGDPFLGFLYFFTLSIGMGLPLAILAVFSGSLNKLPMSGDWMVWVKKFMGWVLIGMAAFIIGPMIDHKTLEAVPLSAVVIAGGIHLGWLDRTGTGRRKFLIFKKASGTLVVIVAIASLVWAGLPRVSVAWIPYDEAALTKAVIDKKPLFFDFYADWCEPCRAMDRKVFSDPEVVKLSKAFATMRLDLTRKQPNQDEILGKFGVKGVPTVIFFNKEGVEEKDLRIEFYVGKSDFLVRMKKALDRSS